MKLVGGDVTAGEYLKTVCTATVTGAAAGLTAYGVEKLIGKVAETVKNIRQAKTTAPKSVETAGKTPTQQTTAELSAKNTANGFKYEHNPSDNPKVLQDAVEDPNAVYGYSPNPESPRIADYAEYDWTDEKIVAGAREARLQYHKDNEPIYNTIKEMQRNGSSAEEIYRVVNPQRNMNRLQSYIKRGDMVGYEKAIQSNIHNFGNELGMTPEQAFIKYGSWEKALERTLSTNAGMDACCGLYDNFFYLYSIGE